MKVLRKLERKDGKKYICLWSSLPSKAGVRHNRAKRLPRHVEVVVPTCSQVQEKMSFPKPPVANKLLCVTTHRCLGISYETNVC